MKKDEFELESRRLGTSLLQGGLWPSYIASDPEIASCFALPSEYFDWKAYYYYYFDKLKQRARNLYSVSPRHVIWLEQDVMNGTIMPYLEYGQTWLPSSRPTNIPDIRMPLI